jgi:hypothetical protein
MVANNCGPNDVDPLKTEDEVFLMDPFTVTSESGGYKVLIPSVDPASAPNWPTPRRPFPSSTPS